MYVVPWSALSRSAAANSDLIATSWASALVFSTRTSASIFWSTVSSSYRFSKRNVRALSTTKSASFCAISSLTITSIFFKVSYSGATDAPRSASSPAASSCLMRTSCASLASFSTNTSASISRRMADLSARATSIWSCNAVTAATRSASVLNVASSARTAACKSSTSRPSWSLTSSLSKSSKI